MDSDGSDRGWVRRTLGSFMSPITQEPITRGPNHSLLQSNVPRANRFSLHHFSRSFDMYLVREIMYCKPGKVRPMVEKFHTMNKLSKKLGMPTMRIMTDFSAERYWTIVAELEVADLKAFED